MLRVFCREVIPTTCASLGYSESAFLTGYIGGLGDSHESQISGMKERDKYPSFYSVPVLSTDSLGLVQLQTLSEDFSAMVSVSNNSSGLIVTALNDIFLLYFFPQVHKNI